MARIEGEYPCVVAQHGCWKRGKKGDTRMVARTIYGNTYANPVTYSTKDPSMAQLAQQERFAQAASKAADDMADIDKKAEWQAIADASHGKYKTARGAAFAAYYAEAGND